ncbi:MAG: bifunctional precorrin-2 dehydrogenase/sirohydrochlorin ferrochelatase [Fluviicola sp.]
MNELYPIFLKAHTLPILIVGGGNVSAEKLRFLLKSSPKANVEVIAPSFNEEVFILAVKHGLTLTKRRFRKSDLKKRSLVIATTDDPSVNQHVYQLCRSRNILVNVADCPEYCDFYLGGIVTKGNLKLAISTNGKSPTTAKRLRQLFEQVLPDEVDELLDNLNDYRKTLELDFEQKVNVLNELTAGLISDSRKTN